MSFVRYDTVGVKECGIMGKKNDLRVQKTYRALMAAFEALMAEETFDDITVNELCARALIRRPTFYSHFEDKYDFLRFYLNEIQWQIESEADAATDSPVEHFQRSWRALIAFIDERPALIRMGLRAASRCQSSSRSSASTSSPVPAGACAPTAAP